MKQNLENWVLIIFDVFWELKFFTVSQNSNNALILDLLYMLIYKETLRQINISVYSSEKKNERNFSNRLNHTTMF